MSALIPAGNWGVIGTEGTWLAHQLGFHELHSVEELQDGKILGVIISLSAHGALPSNLMEFWNLARDQYLPTCFALFDWDVGEVDFDDFALIVGRIFETVVTPYLVLHADDGSPIALIDLQSEEISDYSNFPPEVRKPDSEHLELIAEFQSEYRQRIEEYGVDSFEQGLLFPAIPCVKRLKMGLLELEQVTKRLTTPNGSVREV